MTPVDFVLFEPGDSDTGEALLEALAYWPFQELPGVRTPATVVRDRLRRRRLARGTQILAAAGATAIRGDCDAANVAMVKSFERCGYTNFANRRMFRRALQHLATATIGPTA